MWGLVTFYYLVHLFMYIDSNYFTPAKTGESVGIVCVTLIMNHDTTQQKACQDNGIRLDKKADDLVKGLSTPATL